MSLQKKLNTSARHIRFFIKTFLDKELTLYAAALSFYTIFTLIPLLLIALTFIASLPEFSALYAKIQHFILSNLMPVNSEIVMQQINIFLANASKIGFVGMLSVVVASVLFFQNFEYIVNKIFKVKRRIFWKSALLYWMLVMLMPLALGVSLYISAKLASVMQENSYTAQFDFLPIVPYLIMWGIFFLIFQIAANTKIEPKASMLSSLIVAVIFNLAKNGFVFYVIINKSYTTMYGGFATLLFLFLWIYVSWIIFIYGLKLCHILNEVYRKREQALKSAER